ncbi:ankyrin repeat domain-containing protein [Nocardia sp. NPDC051030]|uniref:ankyrin repeat domain-containing protein n=1 Tax=Nocardia sp. NPDC051030 TaxID=3155162 RepID=UPI0034278B13
MHDEQGGWAGLGRTAWTDPGQIRARLEAGADPDVLLRGEQRPLDMAATQGSAEVVAEVASRVCDVDAMAWGRTALWRAVYANRPDNARALLAAGADPARPMMAGWSPARLSLAGQHPLVTGELSASEQASVEERRQLTMALSRPWIDGVSLVCVAGIDAAEAVRRLDAEVVPAGSVTPDDMASWPLSADTELTMWATDVPGGCVIAQPWSYIASMPGISTRLSPGTKCYGMYFNPKGGCQGSTSLDGALTGSDISPALDPSEDDSAEDILTSYLYQHDVLAYCCAWAGLRPRDARAFAGPPDMWLRVPDGDYRYRP